MRLSYYQPVASQCVGNPLSTADGSKIVLAALKAGKLKWCAISRDLLYLFPKDKPKKIKIEGYGVYEVHDKLGKRHSHMVDILLPPGTKERIHEEKVKIEIVK